MSYSRTRTLRVARCAGIAMLLLCLWALPVAAQERESGERLEPRIGLALGGGGAKGFAHIGVLEVLQEEGVPVDVVTGTSMGAVVGGLYAAGYPVDALDAIARERDWTALFNDAAERRLQPLERRVAEERFLLTIPLGEEGGVALPTGFIAGQRISQLLARLLLPVSDVRDFTALPTPFGAVATDLETGEGVLFTEGALPQVIRASMAIPSVFTPTEIDGRTYIDGGVARNLPAADARRLGADLVICSDVGDPLLPADSLATFVDVLMQAMWYRADASTQAQLAQCDVVVRPDISGLTTFSFDRTEAIIERGRAAADAVRARLAALRDSAGHAPRERGEVFELDREQVAVAEVRVEGVAPIVAERVRAALGVEVPAEVTAGALDAAIERAYSTGLFARVTYRLEPQPGEDGAALVVEAERRTQERLGIGLRYDSPYKAAILLSALLRDRLGVGATTEVSLRLGEALRLGGRYNVPISLRPRLGLLLEAEALRAPIDLFVGGERTTSVSAEVLGGSVQLASIFLDDLMAAVSLRGEAYNLEQDVGGGALFDDPEGLVLGEALLYLDTFERTAFATRGAQVTMRSSATNDAFLSSRSFTQHVLDGEVRAPLTGRLTIIGRLIAGRSLGGELPLHRRFYLGGATPYGLFPDRQFALLGYDVQELSGRSVQAAGLGAQLALPGDLFVIGRWNAARVAGGWDWNPAADDFRSGFGLTLGAATPLGPVELTGMGRAAEGPYEIRLSVGHTF